MGFNETMMYGQAMRNFQGALEHWMGVSTEAKLRKNNEALAAENEELRARLFDIADERDSLTSALREERQKRAKAETDGMVDDDNRYAFRAAVFEIVEKAPQIEAEGFQVNELTSSDSENDCALFYLVAKHRVQIRENDKRPDWISAKDRKRVDALRNGTAPVPECFRENFVPPEPIPVR